MVFFSNNDHHKEKLQRNAIIFKHKVATIIAFSTTIFFLCIENVKSFTSSPISVSNVLLNENTLLFFASGAHTLSKRLKFSPSCPKSASIHPQSNSEQIVQANNSGAASGSPLSHQQRYSLNTLYMALGIMPSESSPPMLDMKTSINAFGGWYNKLDPVARPPVYEDEITDYTFTSPTDSWPSSLDDSENSISEMSSMSRIMPNKRGLRPIRTLRKVVRWVFGTPNRLGEGLVSRPYI